MILRVLIALVLLAGAARAHETTRSYLALTRAGPAVTAELRVAFRDVEVAVWLDADLDGRITWGETRARLDAVAAYVTAGLALTAGGSCPLVLQGAGASREGGLDYLDLDLAAICPEASAPLSLRSRLFADIDPDHRLFLTAAIEGAQVTALLGRSAPEVTLAAAAGGRAAAFARYFLAGAEHLLAGPDHILFLVVLMLPAVTAPGGLGRQAALRVVAAVTGFTLAHALSLAAVASALLRPPTDLINLLIAISIVVTAADNIRGFLPAPRVAIAAAFGLIHGFGFATALGALRLGGLDLVTALAGFNLGIEAAQLGLVALTMPALFMLGGGRALRLAGSLGAGAVGLWWVWVRLAPLGPLG